MNTGYDINNNTSKFSTRSGSLLNSINHKGKEWVDYTTGCDLDTFNEKQPLHCLKLCKKPST